MSIRHLPGRWLLVSERGKPSNEFTRKEGKGQNFNKGCNFWGWLSEMGTKCEVDREKSLSFGVQTIFLIYYCGHIQS